MSRLTATAPPGGRRRTSHPGWPRGPPPVGASKRDLPTGCARRSPERSPGDGGSNPPTSKSAHPSSVSVVGGGARSSYRARIILAQRTASTARIPLGCGRTQSSRFSIRLSARKPFLWWTFSSGIRCLSRKASITKMCSKTYPCVRARGCSGSRTITKPALCLVLPPLQYPLSSAPCSLQVQHVADLICFGRPQLHALRERQEGHRRCRLDGWYSRWHEAHRRIGLSR